MRLSFNPLSRRLACLLSGVAFGLMALGGGEARGAIVLDNGANSQAALLRWLASGFIVDWNQECNVQRVARLDDQVRPSLPVFAPDDATAVAKTETATNKEVASVDAANTNAADDQDYLEYKYGRYGRYYGHKPDTNQTAPQSTDESTKTDDSAKNNESMKNDESANTDDSTKADNSTTDDAAKPGNTTNPDESAGSAETDKSAETSQDDDSAVAEDQNDTTNDGAANAEPSTLSSLEKYYKYRYQSIEDQYGKNAAAATETAHDDATKPQDSIEADNQDANSAPEDEATDEATDEMTGDDEGGDGAVMGDAMLGVVSRWAEDLYARFGMNTSQVTRMLNWIR
jgi:hypothetical protein